MSEINCSRPQDYTFEDKEVLNIFGPVPGGGYSITYLVATGDNRSTRAAVFDSYILKKKPVFQPVVGKWYQFSDCEDFGEAIFGKLVSIAPLDKYLYKIRGDQYRYCRPIPKEIKDQMVFEGEE